MKLKISLLIAAGILSLALTQAQSQPGKDKYLFVISKVNYLKAIEDAVSAKGPDDLNVGEVRVILCGESVKSLQDNDPVIAKSLANGRIELYACGLSLEQMKIDPKTISSKIPMVRNGILEAMMLIKEGYIKFDL